MIPLQPCNHDDSDGASEGGAGQDAYVTDPSDHEDEPENDDWFDQLISNSVSQEDISEVEARELQETQLDESQVFDTQVQFQDSQPRPETELDDLPDSQPWPSPSLPMRPKASWRLMTPQFARLLQQHRQVLVW